MTLDDKIVSEIALSTNNADGTEILIRFVCCIRVLFRPQNTRTRNYPRRRIVRRSLRRLYRRRYDVAAGKIVFTFVKCNDAVSINLSDFIHELTTTIGRLRVRPRRKIARPPNIPTRIFLPVRGTICPRYCPPRPSRRQKHKNKTRFQKNFANRNNQRLGGNFGA